MELASILKLQIGFVVTTVGVDPLYIGMRLICRHNLRNNWSVKA